jgi:hypothetical protein
MLYLQEEDDVDTGRKLTRNGAPSKPEHMSSGWTRCAYNSFVAHVLQHYTWRQRVIPKRRSAYTSKKSLFFTVTGKIAPNSIKLVILLSHKL